MWRTSAATGNRNLSRIFGAERHEFMVSFDGGLGYVAFLTVYGPEGERLRNENLGTEASEAGAMARCEFRATNTAL